MISFNYDTDFILNNEERIAKWIEKAVEAENFKLGDVSYVFCDDDELHKLNLEFLKHDTLTDIISFDYSIGKVIHGEIFISVDRVKENAKDFNVLFEEELLRVIIHGILHYCGYKDKSKKQVELMREKENHYINLLS
ncbi:rRNA maturation RNase YbeY [Litoribaculum gwangyangense]|uniref:Endoribonuclease YbeY n=1 Tax=Litoribaculum gwangyangense TaxID=1130722 RepID=A0ABP9BYP0_9FLAO